MPQQNNPTLSNDELESLLAPSKDQQKYTYPGTAVAGANIGIGIGKGIMSDAESLRNLYNKSTFPLVSTPQAPQKRDTSSQAIPPKYTEPSDWQQRLGKGGERLAEYMYGMGSLPNSMLTQGLAAGGLAGVHSNWDPETMLGTGILGAAGVPIGKLISRLAGSVTPYIPSWIMAHPPTPPPGAGAGGAAGAGPNYAGQYGPAQWFRGVPPASAQYSWSQPPWYHWGASGTPQLPEGQIPTPTPPPQGQIEGASGGAALPSGPAPPRQLNPAPRNIVPAGTEPTLGPQGESALPEAYRNIPVGPPPGPGTMGPVKTNTQPINEGETGSIPERKPGQQEITPTKVFHIAVKDKPGGQFRKATPEEYEQHKEDVASGKTNVGRTARDIAPPEPPTPVKKPTRKTPGLKK